MALLMLFGFVAGAGTALSPCVLPVLPIALSAGATGGRRRPLGIVVGLAVSFTFATVALVYVIAALGLPDDLLRKLAIVVLLAFGVTLMVPPLAARVEAWLSGLAGRVGVAGTGGEGFWSGTAVGASLGLVYAPCAGPILAGVITVSASQSFTAGRLAVALSYGIGSAVVLYLLMLGGRRVVAPLARRGGGFQVAMGAVMVVVALAMLGDYDVRFQNSIASDLPGFLVDPTQSLEQTAAAAERPPRRAGRLGPRDRRQGHRRSPRDASRRRIAPAGARQGARVRRQPALVQHSRRAAADPAVAARPRRAGRLLDLHLHQLPAHPALSEGVGRALPAGRADDRRRPLARVSVRERRRQRRRRDPAQRAALPRRTGQRPCHLERLWQPVLAGRVLRRRPGQRPLRPLRRGLLRREREGDPRASARGRPPGAAGDVRRPRPRPLRHGDDSGELPRHGPRRALRQPDPRARPA